MSNTPFILTDYGQQATTDKVLPILLPVHGTRKSDELAPMILKYLDVLENRERVNACVVQTRDLAGVATAWLCHRPANEHHIRIDAASETREIGWHGRGERTRASLQIHIW